MSGLILILASIGLCHESRKLVENIEEKRPQLPRCSPQGSCLCDQQIKAALQSSPRLIIP